MTDAPEPSPKSWDALASEYVSALELESKADPKGFWGVPRVREAAGTPRVRQALQILTGLRMRLEQLNRA